MTLTAERPVTTDQPPVAAPTRILVTGSRTWKDEEFIRGCLDALVRSDWLGGNPQGWVLVHGACPEGVDAIADRWAVDRGIGRDPHPAKWKEFGKLAGFRRNAEMVQLGAAVCLAFLRVCEKPEHEKHRPHGTHGAADCAAKARTAGIPVWKHKEGW